MKWELGALKILSRNPSVPSVALLDTISEIESLTKKLETARATLKNANKRITELEIEYNSEVETATALGAYLDQAKAENDELKARHHWIDVRERLPEVTDHVSGYVMVSFNASDALAFCVYVSEDWAVEGWTYKKGWYFPNNVTPTSDTVTHWMPKPAGPKVSA